MKLPEKVRGINGEHRNAMECAETAVQHAIRCGELLLEVKDELPRGTFDGWVSRNCEFGRSTAYAYLKAAQSSALVDGFSSLRQALKSLSKVEPANNNDGESGPEGASAPRSEQEPPTNAQPTPHEPEAPDFEWDEEAETAALAQAEAEYTAAIDKMMAADDKVEAAAKELDRQAAEIARLKISRDGFMGAKSEAVKLLKAEQRKTERLSRMLDKANGEIESLRERVAIMEAA